MPATRNIGRLWSLLSVYRKLGLSFLLSSRVEVKYVYFPHFRLSKTKAVRKVGIKWQDIISMSGGDSAVIDVVQWISGVTLDVVGQAIFDIDLGLFEGEERHPLAEAYANTFFKEFSAPKPDSAKSLVLAFCLVERLPKAIIRLVVNHSPAPRFAQIQYSGQVIGQITKKMLNERYDSLGSGRDGKDIVSLLVKANTSTDEKMRLNESEVQSFMNGLLFAGHETSANTLSWIIYELVRCQHRLRAEIPVTLAARGRDLSTSDLDAMPYLGAVIKEALRYHPIAYHNVRISTRDDVIPLSKPITTASGKVLNELPIAKGTYIISSAVAYNRNKDIFGPDADLYHPDRWLKAKPKTRSDAPSIGLIGNLFTFGGGPQSCIGWRFAVHEMQVLLIELMDNFEFYPTDVIPRIRREACRVMVPTIEGEVQKGAQMPIRVKVASRNA
ncbi:cytochrome P450 [Desarmillaria tabescens]|uniref:Cytochrome P450 n=1 Tax=Armillaria tabescens TaxID=1929756 RepID=A0AA39NA75_ARMTA|nr:cytochrome P450 [Desarmillaria tabescens]KAK0461885.1 cytochrome P450 [Desarmillaria tabescens]